MNQLSHWQQLHEALKHNWKAAPWTLPCGFLSTSFTTAKSHFAPLRIAKAVTEVFLN